MPNRPGALSRLVSLFSSRGVSIMGIASELSDDSGLVRLALPHDSDSASILTQAGFSSVETDILSIEVDDKPGQLQRVTDALAEGRINITTVYGTAVQGGETARILIAVQNADKALAILESLAAKI